ncbi:MAG: ABC transporter permease, partial [Patescibacteria group bacterium]
MAMRWRDTIVTASRALTVNKRRAALTMLGIIIGITAVIVIISVGAGAQSLITNQISSIGSNLVGVLPGAADENGPPASVMGVLVTTLTADDAAAIGDSSRVPHIVAVSPYVRGAETIHWQNRTYDGSFIGTGADYPVVEDITMTAGRFFDVEEERAISRVAVLGSEVAQELFVEQDPIGQRIKIKRESFTVIGTVAERGVSGFQNQDNIVL